MIGKDLYKEAIETWGKKPQLLMAIEEMSELTQVICHSFRKNRKPDISELITEVADVKIMLNQIICMYNIEYEVSTEIQLKHEKLKRYLKESKEEKRSGG